MPRKISDWDYRGGNGHADSRKNYEEEPNPSNHKTWVLSHFEERATNGFIVEHKKPVEQNRNEFSSNIVSDFSRNSMKQKN